MQPSAIFVSILLRADLDYQGGFSSLPPKFSCALYAIKTALKPTFMKSFHAGYQYKAGSIRRYTSHLPVILHSQLLSLLITLALSSVCVWNSHLFFVLLSESTFWSLQLQKHQALGRAPLFPHHCLWNNNGVVDTLLDIHTICSHIVLSTPSTSLTPTHRNNQLNLPSSFNTPLAVLAGKKYCTQQQNRLEWEDVTIHNK